MTRLRAFMQGLFEFRLSYTTSFDDLALLQAYDTGREWAHRLTFRFFEN